MDFDVNKFSVISFMGHRSMKRAHTGHHNKVNWWFTPKFSSILGSCRLIALETTLPLVTNLFSMYNYISFLFTPPDWPVLYTWVLPNSLAIHISSPSNNTPPCNIPDNKVHGVDMGPTWVLSAPDGPHVGPMNLAIRDTCSACRITFSAHSHF